MEIKLTDEQLNRAMDAAILVAIGEEGRKQIVQNAVNYLIKRPSGGLYDSPVSPLEQIVRRAASDFAEKIVKAELEKDGEFTESVKKLFTECVERVFIGNREEIISRISTKLSEVFNAR